MTRPIKLIDSAGIAALAGSTDAKFALTKLREDPTFPQPVSGGIGKGRMQWGMGEIKSWCAAYRRGVPSTPRQPNLDNSMAQQVIRRGWKRGGRAIGMKTLHEAVVAGGAHE